MKDELLILSRVMSVFPERSLVPHRPPASPPASWAVYPGAKVLFLSRPVPGACGKQWQANFPTTPSCIQKVTGRQILLSGVVYWKQDCEHVSHSGTTLSRDNFPKIDEGDSDPSDPNYPDSASTRMTNLMFEGWSSFLGESIPGPRVISGGMGPVLPQEQTGLTH